MSIIIKSLVKLEKIKRTVKQWGLHTCTYITSPPAHTNIVYHRAGLFHGHLFHGFCNTLTICENTFLQNLLLTN